ncbi:hypothetical protein ABAC460_21260 [Asticcacaulis sp. AC460]|uniref:DUF1579 family protein n=1 Tax=Asticcacaulis sp. AC460 TaxID=1282360 RepID=UPI0003C3E333|nr:DUF1579 family protein [Asticcacaulis sp. AC460]ESQ87101.1 hypothetical protein ABAC460_21260 [Asticcacaulis sp. AC460]
MKPVLGLLAIAMLMPVAAVAQTPDPQHRMLTGLAGAWDVKQSLWLAPAKDPKIDSGTADFAMVLNGRHLRQTLRIADGTGFEGLGYIGFDGGAFFTTWMDVNFPGMVLARGDCDLNTPACTFSGEMAMPGGPAMPVRETLTITDPAHMRYEFYETRGGVEALAVRLDYSRTK